MGHCCVCVCVCVCVCARVCGAPITTCTTAFLFGSVYNPLYPQKDKIYITYRGGHPLQTAVLISGWQILRSHVAAPKGPECEQEGNLAKNHTGLPTDGGTVGSSQSAPDAVCLTPLWHAIWWKGLWLPPSRRCTVGSKQASHLKYLSGTFFFVKKFTSQSTYASIPQTF